MWRGEAAWFSPDASRIAYVPNEVWQTSWKRYRGGQTTPIYIVRLSDLALEKVQANGELFRVGADHVFDRHRPMAELGVRGQVDRPEAADGQQPVNAVAVVQQRTGRGRCAWN